MPEEVLFAVEQAVVRAFAVLPRPASTSFVGGDPIAVLRFALPETVTYVTIGMSRSPMTAADQFVRGESGPRAELLVQTRSDAGDLWRRMAILAAAPIVEGVVYSDG